MALSSKKKRGKKRRVKPPPDPGEQLYRHKITRAEFDSHADTCTFVKGECLVLGDTGRRVRVGAFLSGLGSLNEIPVVHVAVAYDCPKTGRVVILVYHQVLLIEGMKTHLLNQFQVRNAGIIVNETPLHQLPPDLRLPTSHSVISEDPVFQIPLVLNGVMSGFDVRLPTWEEVNDPENLVIHMTSQDEWDPNETTASEIEQNLREHMGRGTDLLHQEPRELSTLQVRGQDQEDRQL